MNQQTTIDRVISYQWRRASLYLAWTALVVAGGPFVATPTAGATMESERTVVASDIVSLAAEPGASDAGDGGSDQLVLDAQSPGNDARCDSPPCMGENEPTPTSIPAPEPTPKRLPEPTPIPAPEPTPKRLPGPTPIPAPEPTPERLPEPTPIPAPEPTPERLPESAATPAPEPTTTPTALGASSRRAATAPATELADTGFGTWVLVAAALAQIGAGLGLITFRKAGVPDYGCRAKQRYLCRIGPTR